MSAHGTLPAARGSTSGWARALRRVGGPAAVAVLLVPVLAGLALVAVLATGAVLGPTPDQGVTVAVALLVTATAYGPARSGLLAAARRLREGPRTSRYGALSGLASALEAGEDDHDRLGSLVATVARAFDLAYVGVEVDRPDGGTLRVAHGTTTGAARRRPLTYRGEEIGRLLLAPRGHGPATSARDERLLEDLVRQAAAAVRADRLAEQSATARRRLVTACEEERRRIRGALHHDLGPLLGGLEADVEAARPLVRADPAAADRAIAGLAGRLGDAVAEVRRVVHDLRPPALDGRGLLGALDQQADRLRSAGLEVDVVGSGATDELPAAVEVSAYRIAVEALDNVARHADAGSCRVALARDDDRLVLEVVDDGVGVVPDVQAGAGLARLRERAHELGGTVQVGCPPGGGTRVVAVLPAVLAGERGR